MVKEIRNRIQLIGARGKGAKDGKVNKDDCQEDGDNVNCILKEGGGGGVRQGHSASLCWGSKLKNVFSILEFILEDIKSEKGGSEEYKEEEMFVHYVKGLTGMMM